MLGRVVNDLDDDHDGRGLAAPEIQVRRQRHGGVIGEPAW
jgi:hypothetical protein